MLRYLHHLRLDTLFSIMQQWEAGSITLQEEQKARGQLVTLHDIAELRLPEIRSQYEELWPEGRPWPGDAETEERG